MAGKRWAWRSAIPWPNACRAWPGCRSPAWGIDAVLRYADSSLQIGASTLLLKRVEQGEVIDIAHLLAWLEAFVATRADDYA